jgi:hypothetical protein
MLANRIDLYKKIETERNSKLLVYITGDKPGMETQISQEAHDLFLNHLDRFNLPDRITLYLYTRGGDTMAAWGLINLMNQFCNNYEVIIPSKARSAGSLMCLGADRIVMTKQATLGPIDPSLNSHLNPQNPTVPQNPQARVPVSVESIKGYFDYAKQELNISNEGDLSNIFLALSQQIHPIVIGNVFRSRQQIQMLASNLLTKHFPNDQAKVQRIIKFLCSDSGSHDYPIFRREAEEQLGLNVEKPSMEFYQLIKAIYDDIYHELDLSTRFDLNTVTWTSNQYNYSVRRSLIESIDGGTDVFVTEGTLIKGQAQMQLMPNMAPSMQTTIQDNRRFDGWRHEAPSGTTSESGTVEVAQSVVEETGDETATLN